MWHNAILSDAVAHYRPTVHHAPDPTVWPGTALSYRDCDGVAATLAISENSEEIDTKLSPVDVTVGRQHGDVGLSSITHSTLCGRCDSFGRYLECVSSLFVRSRQMFGPKRCRTVPFPPLTDTNQFLHVARSGLAVHWNLPNAANAAAAQLRVAWYMHGSPTPSPQQSMLYIPKAGSVHPFTLLHGIVLRQTQIAIPIQPTPAPYLAWNFTSSRSPLATGPLEKVLFEFPPLHNYHILITWSWRPLSPRRQGGLAPCFAIWVLSPRLFRPLLSEQVLQPPIYEYNGPISCQLPMNHQFLLRQHLPQRY